MSLKFLAALPAALLLSTTASAYTLTNGVGDGTASIEVDFYGAFGDSVGDGEFEGEFDPELDQDFNQFAAFATNPNDNFSGVSTFDPVGAIGAASTIYESFVAYGTGEGNRQILAAGVPVNGELSEASFVSGDALSLVTSFSVGDFDVTLTQSLTDSFNDANELVGSALTQTYVATNTSAEASSFDVLRYVDGDLNFDESIEDSGGIIDVAGNQILFETDSSSEGDASTTFLGITALGGTEPATGRFEISEYSGLRQTVVSGGTLSDMIEGDGDGDGFIDQSYDVTMALANEFTVGAGDTATYTTSTLFGNAVVEDLPTPGESETNPLLPTDLGPEGGFVFVLDAEDVVEGEVIWFDPIVAVGYTYEVTGADFTSVILPSLSSVNDTDGYTVTYGTTSVSVAAGGTVNFATPITSFTVSGINPTLGLDPSDTMAFMTGMTFANVGGTLTMTQTPIEFDTDAGTTPVPIPPAFLLLGTALGLIGWKGRKRAA